MKRGTYREHHAAFLCLKGTKPFPPHFFLPCICACELQNAHSQNSPVCCNIHFLYPGFAHIIFLCFSFFISMGFWYTDTPSSSLSFSIVKCGVSPGSDRPLSRGNFRASAVPSATRTQHRTECHHPCPKNWDYHIVKKKRKLFWKIRDRMGAGTKYHFVSFGSTGKFFWHIPHGIEIKRYFLTTIFFLNHCNFGSGHFQTPPENKDQ